MSRPPKILAFSGSARRDSLNKKLIAIAAKEAKKSGADVTMIDLNDYPIPIYHFDLEQSKGLPDNAKKIKELMIGSDGLMISSPEYNSSISPLLKNVIDWASRKESDDEPPLIAFKDKSAALMSASPSQRGGLRGLVHVRSIFQNIGMLVMPQQVCIPKGNEAFDEQDQLKSEENIESVADLVQNFVTLTKKLIQP